MASNSPKHVQVCYLWRGKLHGFANTASSRSLRLTGSKCDAFDGLAFSFTTGACAMLAPQGDAYSGCTTPGFLFREIHHTIIVSWESHPTTKSFCFCDCGARSAQGVYGSQHSISRPQTQNGPKAGHFPMINPHEQQCTDATSIIC